MKNNTEKNLYIVMLSIFILSMLPVWYLARYIVPCLDDYGFGAVCRHAWNETGSFFAMIKASAEYVKFYFYEKQATYASVFLMCLFPGVVKESFYKITPFIMTGMMIGSLSALIHVIITDCMGVKNRYLTGIVNLLFLLLTIQTLVYPLEAMFWYNGALHYVFMQSVFYFEIALILHYMHTDTKWVKIVCLIVASFLGFVVGGANLITGLLASIFSVFLILFLLVEGIFYKEKKTKLEKIISKVGIRLGRKNIYLIIPALITLIGFIVNATAPGNFIRAEVEEQMNPIKAVLMSFEWGTIYIFSWTTAIVILIFIAITIILWKMSKNTNGQFIRPIVLGIISYGMFCAMFTPTFFATSADAPSRVKNIIGTALYVFYFINIVNGIGYYRSHKKDKAQDNKAVLAKILDQTESKYVACLITLIVIIVGTLVFVPDKNTYTTISAVRSIVNGEAERYYEQGVTRIKLYNDKTQPNITVAHITDDAKPYLLFKQDVDNDGGEGYWQIIQICDFYEKESVTVED